MDIVAVSFLATLVLGAPEGILLGLAAAVMVATVRSRGIIPERARGMLRMGFLQASVTFSLAALVLGEWELVGIVWLIAAFVVYAWRRQGAGTERDRWGLVARFVAALAGFAMAWLLNDWVTTPAAIWPVAVAVLALGVFGATLRWPELPWFAGTVSRVRMLGLTANLAISAFMIGLAFV